MILPICAIENNWLHIAHICTPPISSLLTQEDHNKGNMFIKLAAFQALHSHLSCKQTLKNSVTRSRNFGRQANAWARTSTPAGQHTCVSYRPPAKSSGWPRGLHLQPHHARVIKLQKVSRLISGLVWLHKFSFTGGTLLQLPPVHTVIFLLENAQMKSYVCIYWTVQNVMEPANIMKIEPGPTCIKFRALLGPAQKYQ